MQFLPFGSTGQHSGKSSISRLSLGETIHGQQVESSAAAPLDGGIGGKSAASAHGLQL
jgi:hypothetical protein